MSIPDYTKEAIDFYVENGLCGDFLDAVMSNDLMGALSRADDTNRAHIWDICLYVYNDIPGNCHGSREIVKAWKEKKYADRLAKEL